MQFNARRIYEDFAIVLKPGTLFVDHYLTNNAEILSMALTYHALYGRDDEKEAFRAWVMDQEIE